MDFVSKQHSSYIYDSVRWLEAEYPGSVAHCKDELRKAYSAAKKKEEAARARFIACL